MKITCFATPTSSKSNFVIAYGAWPDRVLKHRGWNKVVYERPATEIEIMEQSYDFRMISYRYETWAEVSHDECKYGVNANWERHNFYKPGVLYDPGRIDTV